MKQTQWWLLLLLGLQSSFAQETTGSLFIEGAERTYTLYMPEHLSSARKYPLVVVLHGGGGTGHNMIRLTRFNDLADRDSFLVVYPDGWKRQWNDRRTGSDLPFEMNDAEYIRQLIHHLTGKHPVDPKQVFATGISNGAIFSLYLAMEIPEVLKAVAPVCGSLPVNYAETYHIRKPVSVLMINGTADPLVRYRGGPVGKKGSDRGAVIATDSTVEILLKQLKCSGEAEKFRFPDVHVKDQSTAERKIWYCTDSIMVGLIAVQNGGHTWPGGVQYLPKSIVGPVNRDFSATAEIWNFFRSLDSR